MNESCPVPTPEQRQAADILASAERVMWETISKALGEAHQQAAEGLKSAGSLEESPPEYFAAVAHQKLFLHLCGADVETMEGGNPEIAARIIENGRNIAGHYWAGGTRTQR